MNERLQFRVLYREFLFRMVDLELLSAEARGDMSKLFGQFASLLIFVSLGLTIIGVGAGRPMRAAATSSLLLEFRTFSDRNHDVGGWPVRRTQLGLYISR